MPANDRWDLIRRLKGQSVASVITENAVKKIPRRTIRRRREINLHQNGYVQEDQTNGVVALV